MIRLSVVVDSIDEIITAGYTLIRVYTDTEEDGDFTTLDGTITLVADTSGYSYIDTDGTTSLWYKTAYYGETPGESSKSDVQQGGTFDAYCTALDVRTELAIGSGASDISEKWDSVLWSMAIEVSRLVDRYKGVEDGAYMATESEDRYLDGNDRVRLSLPWPAVSISAVAVEETDGTYTDWTTATDYFTWPYHEGPILRLDVNSKSDGSKSVWLRGPKRVKVTGVWGVSATVPDLVARACKMQVAQWYKLAMQGWSDSGGAAPEFGQLQYPRKLDKATRTLIGLAQPRRARI